MDRQEDPLNKGDAIAIEQHTGNTSEPDAGYAVVELFRIGCRVMELVQNHNLMSSGHFSGTLSVILRQLLTLKAL